MCVSYTNAEHKALSADFVQHLLWSGPSPSQTNTERGRDLRKENLFSISPKANKCQKAMQASGESPCKDDLLAEEILCFKPLIYVYSTKL